MVHYCVVVVQTSDYVAIIRNSPFESLPCLSQFLSLDDIFFVAGIVAGRVVAKYGE